MNNLSSAIQSLSLLVSLPKKNPSVSGSPLLFIASSRFSRSSLFNGSVLQLNSPFDKSTHLFQVYGL